LLALEGRTEARLEPITIFLRQPVQNLIPGLPALAAQALEGEPKLNRFGHGKGFFVRICHDDPGVCGDTAAPLAA
jgi:hypothetical protein